MTLMELITKLGFDVDEKPLDKLEEKLEHIRHRLEFLAAAEVVKGIFELSERFSGFAEQLGTAAQSAGLTVEALQRLQFAAGLSGVSAEETQGSLARLSRALYEARNGSKEAQKAFADAGISQAQIAGFRTSADALSALGDRMQGMSDPIKKQAVAMTLLGRGSFKMVGFLSQGGKAMDQAGKDADKMGAILAGPNLEALREVEDALSGLWQVVKTFAATVASFFAPAIKSLVGQLLQFYAAYRQIILTKINEWAGDFAFAMGFTFETVRIGVAVFARFAAAHRDLIDWIIKTATRLGALALAVMVIGWVIEKGKEVYGAFKLGIEAATKAMKLFGIIQKFALGPTGLMIMGVIALVVVLKSLYDMVFNGKAFKDTWLGEALDAVGGFAKSAFNFVKTGAGKVMDYAGGKSDLTPEERARDESRAAFNQADASRSAATDSMFAKMTEGGALGGGMGFGRLAEMMRSGVGPLAAGPVTSDAGTEAETLDYQVQAPVTINVPAGTPPGAVAPAVKDAIREHMDGVYRDLRRTTRTAKAY